MTNSTAYGIPIEMNVVEHRRPVGATVHLPDGSSYRTHSRRVEQPGRLFHPLIATLVASGGRLLLATAMALVHEKAGAYVFCDTRTAVNAPGQPDRLLSSPDGLHPSPDGYKRLADALEPAISAALAKAQSLR